MVIRISSLSVIVFFLLLLAVYLAWSFIDYLEYTTYQVAVDRNVSGLTADAPVEYNGVVVGYIDRVIFERKKSKQIKLLLRVQRDTPITKGTVASFGVSEVVTQKLTGFPYIFIRLTDVDDDFTPLTIETGQAYPVIPMSKKGSDEEPLEPSLVKMSKSIQQTKNLMKPLLTEENAESLRQILYSLQQVAGVLAANSDKLDSLLVNLESASKDFKPLFQSGSDSLVMFKSQLMPQVYRLSSKVDNTLSIMQQLLEKVEANPTVIIRGEAMPRLGPGESVP